MHCVLEAEPLMYLTMIIQGLVAAVYRVLGAEPLVYLTKITEVRAACCVVFVGGRALGVSDQDYQRAGG